MVRFLWNASRGYRLRPWASPYVRWRVETYSGLHADEITPRLFWQFFWREKSELWRFLRWAGRMDTRTARRG